MKTYRGVRDDGGCTVLVQDGFRHAALNPRTDLFNHSPDGFEWGYAGSGPAQLALALLADALGDDERALSLHQRFKAAFVAQIEDDTWSITDAAIIARVHEIEAEDA